jgi:hypothetical protein
MDISRSYISGIVTISLQYIIARAPEHHSHNHYMETLPATDTIDSEMRASHPQEESSPDKDRYFFSNVIAIAIF